MKKNNRAVRRGMARSLVFAALLLSATGSAFLVPAMPSNAAAVAAPSAVKSDSSSIQFSHEGSLGIALTSVFAQYGKNVAFGAEVANIPVVLQIEAANFEQMIYMLEIAANVEITKIGDKAYSVKTFADSQKRREAAFSEQERELQRERQEQERQEVRMRIERESETEKQRTFNEALNRLENTQIKIFDVKFIAEDDLEKAMQEVMGDDFKDIVRFKTLSGGGTRNYNSILVSAPNLQIIDRVGEVIKAIDREKPLVEIEALFVEIALNDQNEAGFDWSIFPSPFEYKELPILSGTTIGEVFDPHSFNRFARTTGGAISAQLRMLSETGKGRVLANPKGRGMSGRKFTFASDIQEPVMSINNDNEVRVDYKNVGILLEALPTVREDGSIYLKIVARSSTITGEKVLKDSTAPQISERRTETEVILQPNETMIMSGLMYDRDFTTRSRVPVLSSIPLVGELFKSSERKQERYQIIVFLRPKLIPITPNSIRGAGSADEQMTMTELWNKYKKVKLEDAVKSRDIEQLGSVETPVVVLSLDISETLISEDKRIPLTVAPVLESPTPILPHVDVIDMEMTDEEKAEQLKMEKAGVPVRKKKRTNAEYEARFNQIIKEVEGE